MIRVAVVDDEILLRSGLASRIDSAHDMTVVGEAGNGAEAVRLASEVQPHVMLMDIRMSEMDGLEATRRIVQDAGNAGTRVLILTTFDMTAFEAGFAIPGTP